MFDNTQKPSAAEAGKQKCIALFQKEQELIATRRSLVALTAAAEAGAGAAILEGASIEDATRATTAAQAQARAVNHAIALVRRQRRDAIEAMYVAEAVEKRATAVALRAQAAAIVDKCRPYLAKLATIEEVASYSPAILLAERCGVWLNDLIFGRPPEECSPDEMGRDISSAFVVPKSAALRNSARVLDGQADAAEHRRVHDEYRIQKPSLAELLAAEETNNPEMLAPSLLAIEDWAAGLEARVAHKNAALLSGDRLRSYTLSWQNGEIDTEASDLAFVRASQGGNDPRFSMDFEQAPIRDSGWGRL